MRCEVYIEMRHGCNCPGLQYPSLFTVEGEWVSITQTIKVNIKTFYNIRIFYKIYYDTL